MASAAPRIGPTLLAAIERFDEDGIALAEVHRRVAALASHLGLSRPSYEQTRVLIHEHRRCGLAPSAGQILLDVALRSKPPEALLELLEGAK